MLEALEGPSEHIGDVSEESDKDETDLLDNFGYL